MSLNISDIAKAMALNKNKVANKIYTQPTAQDELYSLDVERKEFLNYWEPHCREKALDQSLHRKICCSCDTETAIDSILCPNCKYQFSTNIYDMTALQEVTKKKIYDIYYKQYIADELKIFEQRERDILRRLK
jgi:hypothetical protein